MSVPPHSSAERDRLLAVLRRRYGLMENAGFQPSQALPPLSEDFLGDIERRVGAMAGGTFGTSHDFVGIASWFGSHWVRRTFLVGVEVRQ